MAQLSKIAGIILVLIVGCFVQILFVFAGTKDTPTKAVVEFSKAYFQLDKSMAKRICDARLASEEIDIVDQHIHNAAKEAKERGFDITFMQRKFYDIEINTIKQADNNAQIRITGKTRVAINPVYPIVAKLFDLSEVHEVDETITLVKEHGKWKVCGKLFDLPEI
jgi:hypothetical protein